MATEKHNAAHGMTLVELLVVITILTTLVAGVIPILSPNNDVRKLREASRGLQAYITSAQSEAARTGRPHGVGIRESAPGSGAALEIFHLEVPPPYAGFSIASRVAIIAAGPTYDGVLNERYFNAPLWDLTFQAAPAPPAPPHTTDPIPPQTFRLFDRVNVDGNHYLIVDDNDPNTPPNAVDIIGNPPNVQQYLRETDVVRCIWLNDNGQLPPAGLKRYTITRQPAPSSEAPFQLPRGIAVDLLASGVDGGVTHTVNTNDPVPQLPSSFYDSVLPELSPQQSNLVQIMLSPAGYVESVYFNSRQVDNFSRVMLLLGRVENALPDENDYVFNQNESNDEVADRRLRVNWLNADSRWVVISGNSGRVTTSENAIFDPRIPSPQQVDTPAEELAYQVDQAHEFAREMRQVGSN